MQHIKSVAAMAAAMAAASLSYPVRATIGNTVWRGFIEPELGASVPGEGRVEVSIRDADQLQRVLTNIEQLNLVNQIPESDGLSLLFEVPQPNDPAAAEAAARAAAAEAAAAEAAAKQAAEKAAAEEAARQAAGGKKKS